MLVCYKQIHATLKAVKTTTAPGWPRFLVYGKIVSNNLLSPISALVLSVLKIVRGDCIGHSVPTTLLFVFRSQVFLYIWRVYVRNVLTKLMTSKEVLSFFRCVADNASHTAITQFAELRFLRRYRFAMGLCHLGTSLLFWTQASAGIR
jgi:hypothetical protein